MHDCRSSYKFISMNDQILKAKASSSLNLVPTDSWIPFRILEGLLALFKASFNISDNCVWSFALDLTSADFNILAVDSSDKVFVISCFLFDLFKLSANYFEGNSALEVDSRKSFSVDRFFNDLGISKFAHSRAVFFQTGPYIC